MTVASLTGLNRTRYVLALPGVSQRGGPFEDWLGLRAEPYGVEVARVFVGIICRVGRVFRE